MSDTAAEDNVPHSPADRAIIVVQKLSMLVQEYQLTRQEVIAMMAVFIASSLNNKTMINKVMKKLRSNLDDLIHRGEKEGVLLSDDEYEERVKRMHRTKSEDLV
jgi:hypothetical protein